MKKSRTADKLPGSFTLTHIPTHHTENMNSGHGLFQLYPIVPLCVCLIGGIHLGHALCPGITPMWPLAAAAAALGAAFAVPRRPRLQTSMLLAATFCLGLSRVATTERAMTVRLPQGETTFNAVITSQPVERGRTMRFDMILASGPLCGHTVRASLLKDTATLRYRSLRAGDGITVSSSLEQPRNFHSSAFNYATWLKSRGIIATTFIYYRNWHGNRVSLNGLSLTDRTRIAAIKQRRSLLDRYRSLGLGGQSFAVVAAMTLGDKTALTDDTLDAYSATGASHVLALSGLHLGIIYALLSFMAVGRRFRTARESVLLLAVWAYVFLVGLSPSVMRAAVMVSVCSIVGLTGRRPLSANTLALAAVALLTANPLVLYDIGFQLSFAAVAFIVVFKFVCGIVPYKFQQSHRLAGWLWQLFAVSLLAQLGTSPLVALYFGRLPLLSLPVNFLVIPVATVILYGSAAMLALSPLPMAGTAVATALSFVTGFLNSALSLVASLPCSTVSVSPGPLQTVLVYIVIVSLLQSLRLFLRSRRDSMKLSDN